MEKISRRELIAVVAAGTIVIMGLGFIIPLFPIYVTKKGANSFQLGLIISGFTISQFLVQPFFGGLSDRFGRKPFMLGGMICYSLVALLYIFANSLIQVFLVRLLHGIGAGMVWPAVAAFIIDKSPLEKRGEVIGLLSAVEMLGFAIGPFLGGVLYGLGGMDLPFLGCSFLALLSMSLIWRFIQRETPSAKENLLSWGDRYGLSSLRIADVRLICLIGFAEAFVWGTIITILPVMASKVGISPERIGWLFTSYFLVFILLQRPMGRWSDQAGRKKPILLGMIIYALAVWLLSLSGSLLYLLFILALAGAGLGIYSPSVRVAMADLTSAEVRGASMGIFFTVRMVGFFLGPNIAGVMADHFGQGSPFLMGSIALAGGVWAALTLSNKLAKKSTFPMA